MSELKRFKLPDVGEGLTEAEIVKWHVAAGDAVEINQTIVEIETAKAVVELPCPFEGTVAELLVEEGATVDVGVPIIAVDVGGGEAGGEPGGTAAENAEALKEDLVPVPEEPGMTAPEEPKRQPVLVGYGVKPGATKRRARKAAPPPRPQPADGGRPLAKPPVRKMAKDLGVDLSAITGTGPEGSITRDDVRAAQRPAATPAQAPAAQADEERIPVKGVRKATAAAMVASAFTAPHVTEFLQVDVTRTMETVRRLRELPEFAEVKVSPLLLVAKALLTAVARTPAANAAWDGDAIVVRHRVNLGIAAATERGLVVPNVKDAHALSLPELAAALHRLAETARSGRASPADLTGGTITITNVGVFGVDAGTPILTPGEAAILAFGQVRDMPWVHEGELAVRRVTTLALSFDHRVMDGAEGSAVLRDVGAMLEDPIRMLAWN
ncbi:dihydrolipoamide acetyltransferase family protein [Actinomadura parmotrematis]|uniref:Dihydrolipoamide acetyltransferase component of pyruvate dehydrogenase complex n=1 Tax=Actinomadura parmotrematis TaxID=2864039 RepID=A0ABS7FPA3_9ACTN|nr:dihydrolipoamide acetyltransferase family protein [Actinomadura parmotrematis]MBW8482050.1 2-oxo acid dehydrogenase subunit E2 [Actinomadura parmotrematis]